MVAALDHWTTVRGRRETQERRMAQARRGRPGRRPRPRARRPPGGAAVEDKVQRLERVRPLAERAEAADWSPASLVLLGSTLANAGDVDAGVRVLRQASAIHPTDLWVQHTLGILLELMKRPAPRTKRSRRTPRPAPFAPSWATSWPTNSIATGRLSRPRRSSATWSAAVPWWRGTWVAWVLFSTSLGRAAEAGLVFERAVAVGREAVRLRPNDSTAHLDLGDAS